MWKRDLGAGVPGGAVRIGVEQPVRWCTKVVAAPLVWQKWVRTFAVLRELDVGNGCPLPRR
jgi:hypothetical protein